MIYTVKRQCIDWKKKPNFITTFFYSTTPTPITILLYQFYCPITICTPYNCLSSMWLRWILIVRSICRSSSLFSITHRVYSPSNISMQGIVYNHVSIPEIDRRKTTFLPLSYKETISSNPMLVGDCM